LLVAAMEQITAATPTASQVKANVLALNASFGVANYGWRSFRDFLGQARASSAHRRPSGTTSSSPQSSSPAVTLRRSPGAHAVT
jgi:hypothetical protein